MPRPRSLLAECFGTERAASADGGRDWRADVARFHLLAYRKAQCGSNRMAPNAARTLDAELAAAALHEENAAFDAAPPTAPEGLGEGADGGGTFRIGKRPRSEGGEEGAPEEGASAEAQTKLPKTQPPNEVSSRPSAVGREASVPTKRLFWLKAALDEDQTLTDEQKSALALITPEDVFASLMLQALECNEAYPEAPQTFVQTDPEDADPKEGRAASLKVALGSAEHAGMLKTHAHKGFMVAPADLVDAPTAYVRYILHHTSSVPLMARALREQGGLWIEIFARGAPYAYTRAEVKHAVMTQIKGARVITVRQPPGLKTEDGESMAELAGVKPKFMVTLEHTEGLARALPPTINLPGEWPATYRVDPTAFPHLCAKCHRLKTGACICKAARLQVDRRLPQGQAGRGAARTDGNGGRVGVVRNRGPAVPVEARRASQLDKLLGHRGKAAAGALERAKATHAQFARVCRDWNGQPGSCPRGDACWFKHDAGGTAAGDATMAHEPGEACPGSPGRGRRRPQKEYDDTLGYPGEGPTKLIVLSHNEGGLRGPNRLRECLIEFRRTPAHVLLLQETKLDASQSKDAEKTARGLGMWAKFAGRADGAAREGTAIVIKTREIECESGQIVASTASDGRYTCAAFTAFGVKHKCASVYLPPVPSERKDTICDIQSSGLLDKCTVIGGDFNCVPERSLDTIRRADAPYSNAHSLEWEALMSEYGLSDQLRVQRGRVKGPFTCLRAGTGSATRIDRIYVKQVNGLQWDMDVDDRFGLSNNRSQPDHRAVTAQCTQVNIEERGRDVFRVNASLLERASVRNELQDLHARTLEDYPPGVYGYGSTWGVFKERAKNLLERLTKNENRRRKGTARTFETLLKYWRGRTDTQGATPEGAQLKAVINKKIIEARAAQAPKGAAYRAKQLAYEEASTKEYYSNFKPHHEMQWIASLNVVPDWDADPSGQGAGIKTSTSGETLREATKYYQHLFGPKASDDGATEKMSKLLRKRTLTAGSAASLEAEITIEEVRAAMASLSSGKSAGPDGLPNEFYKWMGETIAPTLTEALRQAHEDRLLPETLGTGYVSLLYKKKERDNIKNYRPITLLNCDYKILTRILCKRMQKVMHEVTSIENTGFCPGRFIAENSQLTKLLQAYLDEEDLPGAFIFLDMEKAFDRVSWSFLHRALKELGFGARFRKWISLLYDEHNAPRRYLRINGYTGPRFEIKSGVAQGCPLSPLLFLCVAEALTRAVNANNKIKGITVKGHEIKLSQFADDTKLTLRDAKGSWSAAKKTIEQYCKASGQAVNIAKTEGLLCGSLRGTEGTAEIKWCPEGEYIISLGVPIGHNFDEDEFWLSKYHKTKSRMAN